MVGAFYYLRIVKVMYFDKPEEEKAPAMPGGDMGGMGGMGGMY